MPSEETAAGCDRCGGAVPLFAPSCPECDARQRWSYGAPCRSCGVEADHRRPRCPACGAALDVWDAVVDRVRRRGYHEDLVVSRALARPETAGFEPSSGKPVGQRADYRRPLPDDTEIHVREFADRYEVHRDRRTAGDPLGHLARDAPLETAAGAALLYLLARGLGRLPRPSPDRLPTPSRGLLPTPSRGLLPTPSAAELPTPRTAELPTPSADRLRDPIPSMLSTDRLRLPRPSTDRLPTPRLPIPSVDRLRPSVDRLRPSVDRLRPSVDRLRFRSP